MHSEVKSRNTLDSSFKACFSAASWTKRLSLKKAAWFLCWTKALRLKQVLYIGRLLYRLS